MYNALSFLVGIVSICARSPSLLPSGVALIVVTGAAFYARVVFAKSYRLKITAKKHSGLLSGKVPPPVLPLVPNNAPISSPKLDVLLTEIIDLSLRDFVLSWFSDPLVKRTQTVAEIGRGLMWNVIHLVHQKLGDVDLVTLVTQDLMIKMFDQFQAIRNSQENQVEFQFKDFLGDVEAEKRYLKTSSIALLQVITPPSIWKSQLFTEIIGDVLSNYVLHPLTHSVTESHYIYENILYYMEQFEPKVEPVARYSQAQTYEDFIKKINKENDLDNLRQLRYQVIGEIMQAMTIETAKQENDLEGVLSQINSKSYRLSLRNLNRYIKQCKVAKTRCEKRIAALTRAQGVEPHYTDMSFNEETKLITLDEILHSPYVMPFFVQYLEVQHEYASLKLWSLIEQAREAERTPGQEGLVYSTVEQCYNDHLLATSPLRVHLSRRYIRMVEAYVDQKSQYWQCVYDIQGELVQMMQDNHYRSFLVSPQYMQYICSTEGARGGETDDEEDEVRSVDTHITCSRVECVKLSVLKNELKSKELLHSTLEMMDYCTAEEMKQLEDEISSLRVTINQLEHHSERTEVWWRSLDYWQVEVQSVEVTNNSPLYTIVVQHKVTTHTTEELRTDNTLIRIHQFYPPQSSEDGEQSGGMLCLCQSLRSKNIKGKRKTMKVAVPVEKEVESYHTLQPQSILADHIQQELEEEQQAESEDEYIEDDHPADHVTDSLTTLDGYHDYHADTLDDNDSDMSLIDLPDSLRTPPPMFNTRVGNSTFAYRGRKLSQHSEDTISVNSDFDKQQYTSTIRSYLANDAESLQFEIEDNHSSLGTISIKSSDMEHQLLKQNVQLSTATNEIESHQKVSDYLNNRVLSSSAEDDISTIMGSSVMDEKGSIVDPEDISDVTSMMTIDMAESDGPFYDLNHDTESRSRVSTRYDSSGSRLSSYHDGQHEDMRIEDDCVSDSSNEESPYLVIDMAAQHPVAESEISEESVEADASEIQRGWVITHTLEDVKALHTSLKGCVHWFPEQLPLGKDVEKSKEELTDFLNTILRDRLLRQSEGVYRFFNPSCERLYTATSNSSLRTIDEEEKAKDTIAIPFYNLVGEMFELHGRLQWVRRQTVFLIRITFGSTIERQISRAMAWCCEEQQVLWYLQTFHGCLWPLHQQEHKPATDEEKHRTREEVVSRLLDNPPQLLLVLFGPGKTKKGLQKVAEFIDSQDHPRQFVFTMLELLLLQVVGTRRYRPTSINFGSNAELRGHVSLP